MTGFFAASMFGSMVETNLIRIIFIVILIPLTIIGMFVLKAIVRSIDASIKFRQLDQQCSHLVRYNHESPWNSMNEGLTSLEDFQRGLLNEIEVYHDLVHCGPYVDGYVSIMVNSPPLVKQMLRDTQSYQKFTPTYEITRMCMGNVRHVQEETSPSTSPKEEKKLSSESIQNSLHQQMVKRITDETSNLIKTLKETNNTQFDCKQVFQKFFLTLLLRSTLGTQMKYEQDFLELCESYFQLKSSWVGGYTTFGSLWNFVPAQHGRGFILIRDSMRAIVLEELKRRKDKRESSPKPDASTSNDATDWMDFLIDSETDGMTKKDDKIVDECLELILDGTEKLSAVLTWILYYMTMHWDTQQKAQQEISILLPENQSLDAENLERFNYVNGFVNETLRLRPPYPILDRITTKEVDMNGTSIPAGCCVQANLYAVSHDSRVYNNPEQFFPERWLSSTSPNSDSNLSYSVGSKNSLSSTVASQVIVLSSILLCGKFDFNFDHSKTTVKSSWEGVYAPKNFQPSCTYRRKSITNIDISCSPFQHHQK